MLPKTRKLRARPVFADIFKGGKRFYGRYQTTYIVKTSGQSKFACVVSLKVSKSAVLRNKVRRWGFAAIAHLLPRLKDGYGVVLVFKAEALKAGFSEIAADITEVFQKAAIIPPPDLGRP